MQKLFLLFAVLFAVLLGCEQSTDISMPKPEIIPTEGVIGGKNWLIDEIRVIFSGTVETDAPALVYSMEGEGSYNYTFMVAKYPDDPDDADGYYWFLVEVERGTPEFTETYYDKLRLKDNNDLNMVLSHPDGRWDVGILQERYHYRIHAALTPNQFAVLTNASGLKVELSKDTKVVDSFVVSENFQKLLKIFNFVE